MSTLKIVMLPIESVTPHPKNPKKHPESQVKSLAETIRRQGWDVPIVLDRDHVIIKGHGRRLAAIHLGLKEVPCIIRDDLTPEQADAARLTDNYVVSNDYDQAVLREQLQALNEQLRGIVSDKELAFTSADLGLTDDSKFIADLNAAVSEHEGVARQAADEVIARRVPLAKAFGFKDIAGADELLITRWMAKLEAETGLAGAEALAAFLRQGE
jgi:ParB-like chromosome segregation protein Spo0J